MQRPSILIENVSLSLGGNAGIVDILKDISLDIQEGERPDHVSQKLYNTPIYHWTFFLCNPNMKSLETDWPVPSNDLEEKLKHDFPHTILTINTFDFFKKGI